jgi:hypothetical protein
LFLTLLDQAQLLGALRMTNIFSVKLLKNGQLIQQRQVHTGLAQSTGAVRIKAQADMVYVLSSETSKKTVSKITTHRVGNDIHMVLDDSTKGKPQLIIEGYFEPNQNSALATLGSDGLLVLFSAPVQESPLQATTEAYSVVVQTAEGADASWWGSPGVQLAMIAGGIFAFKSKSGDSPTPQPSQDSIVAYATGAAQATTPTEATYRDAGYTGVTLNSVGAINSAVLRTRTKDSAGIQKIITAYQKLFDKANGSTADTTINDPTLSDYQTLGIALLNIERASNGNPLGLLNDIIKSRNLGDINSVTKLDGFVNTVDKIMLLAKGDAPSSPLTTAELNSIGLSDVIEGNIAAIRSAIGASSDDGEGVRSITQLKDIQTAYLKVLAQADGVKGNTVDATKTPTVSELKTLGVTLGKAGTTGDAQQANALKLLNDVIDGLNNEAVNSVAEISALATTIDKVMNVAKAAHNADALGIGLLASELTGLGLNSVTNDNLAQVAEAIRLTQSSDGSKVNTFKQMQSAIDLGVIMQYAQSDLGTPGRIAPTLAQYQSAGVVTTDSGTNKAISNLNAINSAVEALKADKVNTSAELQTLVNTYSKLLSLADGSKTTPSTPLTLAEYLSLGALTNFDPISGAIDGSTSAKATASSNIQSAASLRLLNDVIDAKSSAQVDSIIEINALSIAVDKLIDQASTSPTSTLNVNDFNASQAAFLGIQNVNDKNLSQVISDLRSASTSFIDGTAIDTLAEIQSLVSLASLKLYALNDIDYQLPTQPTSLTQLYKDLGFDETSRVTWTDPLATSVNSVVKYLEKDNITIDKIKSVALAYQSVLQEATSGNNNSNANPTAAQYKEILKGPSETTVIHLYETATNDTTTTSLNSNALALLNDVVRFKNVNLITNQLTLENYARAVDKLMNLTEASSVTSSQLTINDLTTLGFSINSAWSSNSAPSTGTTGFSYKVAQFDDHGASIRTWDQLQTLISNSSVF